MSEQSNNSIPKPMEFDVELPDREIQYQKTPAMIKKTKMARQITVETIDGVDNQVESDPVDVEYTEMTTDTDENGNITPVMLSQLNDKVEASIALHAGKQGIFDLNSLAPVQQKQVILAEAINDTYADPETGVISDEDLKHKGKWGLGCPGNCGHFWEFMYEDMVPQLLTCPVCGVKITLEG